ncbi:UNVERIFIED_CONTAM: hypothetical protein Sangu_0620200 [Sesamum angustifolium]|uniref:Uncharacterized protein n=1 Tax=Sesamum angustifolium TaxID=2727405 RepID=A0AAW2QBP3_9LAMI
MRMQSARMQRKKGQFTSSKSLPEEPGSSSADWNGSSAQEEQENLLKVHSNDATWTRWAKNSVQRMRPQVGQQGSPARPSKLPIVEAQHHAMKAGEVINSETNGKDTVAPSTNIITSSTGEN